MRKVFWMLPVILLFLTGCTEEKDLMQRELDHVLNDMQQQEREIVSHENRLEQLETKEQVLFEKTMELNVEDREPLKSNVSKLEFSLKERTELIQKEKESVAEIEETAKELRELPPAETEEGDQAVAKLTRALDKRIALHYETVGLYEDLLAAQEKVYDLLIDENVKRVDLEEAAGSVNNKRAELEEIVQVFNQSTIEVNNALEETQQIDSD